MESAVIPQSPAELEFTQENVETALYQSYFDPDMERKNVAQVWLTQAQASAQAWRFCWASLSPDKIPEVQFFGASTLHIKICRHWSDLPAEQHEDLRTQLLSHILCFSSGPKMVSTRSCVASASMALNLIPQAWSQPVADMVRAFQPQKPESQDNPGATSSQDPHAHCLALSELLTVLPEEFQSGRSTQARRAQSREASAGEWTVVCSMLRQSLQSQDSSVQVKEKVLRCLSSWVGSDVPLEETQELVQDCFTASSDPGLFDTAVETIVTAISQPDCQRFINALSSSMPSVSGLYDRSKTAAQDEDMETTHGICRIAIALGETHSRALSEQSDHWQEYSALVNMISFCTGIPGHYPVNETTSSSTLTFWYTSQDDISSFEEDKQAVYSQVYKPIYFQSVDVLLSKSHYPSQQEYASWSSDDKEQFRIYRVDISDTLMYVYESSGAESSSNLYDRSGRSLMDPQQTAAWQDTEASSFGFQSIAETIDVNYSDVIPGLIGLIPRINISNVMSADTVMYTIGSLAEWLADHPVMSGGILPMVSRGLGKAESSVSSISTLKRICRECRQYLIPYAKDILTVSQDASMKDIHESSQCMWSMQASGFSMSALPAEEILGRSHSLITPHIQRSDTSAQHEPDPAHKRSIVYISNMSSSLFTTSDVKHADGLEDKASQSIQNPAVVVSQQVFPLIQTIISKWLHDSEVVEAVCGVFEKSVRTLLHDFGPMVAQSSEMSGQIYNTYPQAPASDSTRQMVHIFAGEKQHIPDIRRLVEVSTITTLSIFQQGPREHPDIIESFMHLHAQILKRSPDLYSSTQFDVKASFYSGISSIKFPETPTVKAACLFFSEFVSRCKETSAFSDVSQSDGKISTETVLQAVGGGSPRSSAEHFAEVSLGSNRQCPTLLSQWSTETSQTPGFPSAHVTPEQKHTFSQQISREQTNKRRVKETVKEFSSLCRGSQGSGFSEC